MNNMRKKYKRAICPYCGSKNIDILNDNWNSNYTKLWYDCSCNDCNNNWEEHYDVVFKKIKKIK